MKDLLIPEEGDHSYSLMLQLFTPMESPMSTPTPTDPLNSPDVDSSALRQLLVKTLQSEMINALSFTDPWGSAVAVGAKRIETRSLCTLQ